MAMFALKLQLVPAFLGYKNIIPSSGAENIFEKNPSRRRIAEAGHQAIVDDLVYELLRKMAKGGVSWPNPFVSLYATYTSHHQSPETAGKCHSHSRSCRSNCQPQP